MENTLYDNPDMKLIQNLDLHLSGMDTSNSHTEMKQINAYQLLS